MGLTHPFPIAQCALVLLVVLSGCDGTSEESAPRPDPTRPQPLPRATAADYVTAQPVTKDGRYRFRSVSSSVKVGVPYRYALFTSCGLDYFVDFNSSLWAAVGIGGRAKQEPPPGFDEPRDLGTMTLINQELAEYVSSEGKSVRFITRSDRKLNEPCT